jgi:Fe-S cluster assembly iron-binding protein IscA
MAIISVADSTIQDLKQVLQDGGMNSTTLRLYLKAGWGGNSFSLALDEPTERDVVEEIDGLKFLVDQALQEQYSGFTIESMNYGQRMGFHITPLMDNTDGGCSSCSSCS